MLVTSKKRDWNKTKAMDIQHLISDLTQQRDQISLAIAALERIAGGTGKRRGRPPKALSLVSAAPAKAATGGKKRVISAEARKRMAEAQKRRWAAYHSKQAS